MRSGHPGVPLVEVTEKNGQEPARGRSHLGMPIGQVGALSTTGVIAVPRPIFQDGNGKRG